MAMEMISKNPRKQEIQDMQRSQRTKMRSTTKISKSKSQ